MQETGVDEEDAARHGASWYLSRDGQQHGPLTDRELSLFAEGGNFEPGDLLWTAGLDGWKPAEAIFGLAPNDEGKGEAAEDAASHVDEAGDAFFAVDDEDEATSGRPVPVEETASADAAFAAPGGSQGAVVLDDPRRHPSDGAHLEGDHPNGEQVHALVQALQSQTEPPKATFKERVFAALKKCAGAFAYLWTVFALLTLHAWLGDAVHGAGLSLFVLVTINAFFVLQLMARAEGLRFVQGLKEKPLVYSVVYGTVFFSTLVIALYALEVAFFGALGGGGFSAGLEGLGGLSGLVTFWFILSCAMIPYFAFKAFERAVGPDMIGKLLFGRN